MITSLFKKSTPLNYTLVIIAVVVFFFVSNGTTFKRNFLAFLSAKFGTLALIFASLFAVNFIVKRNGLSKDSSYMILFYLLFLLFFPSVFDRPALILSNFFIVMALRRLISLHSLKSTKEKIFDASLLIFIATLFHFWSIIFISLVFLSILFHVSRDYRNWLLPFLALIAISIVFVFFALLFDETLITALIANTHVNVSIDYFANNNQNAALSIFASVSLFFTISMLLSLSTRPLLLHASYKKIIASFFYRRDGFFNFTSKNNDILIFTFAPLAVMATNFIELPQNQLRQEIALGIVIICSFVLFFLQL